MQVTLYVDEKRYNEILEKGFDSSLGNYFHNIAVLSAPYDTGNLRMSISLAKNTPRHIKIKYNTTQANYIKFLEEGIGPVKKHKGFISVLTAGAIAEQLMSWIVNGKNPDVAISPQIVEMRVSKYKPFAINSKSTGLNEQGLLRQAMMNDEIITAQARREISKVREYTYRTLEGGKAQGNMSGKYPYPTSIKGARSTKRKNKNISILKAIAQDRKEAYKQNRNETQDLINMRGV